MIKPKWMIEAENKRVKLTSSQGKSPPLPEVTRKEMAIVLNWYADRLENWFKSFNEMIQHRPRETK